MGVVAQSTQRTNALLMTRFPGSLVFSVLHSQAQEEKLKLAQLQNASFDP